MQIFVGIFLALSFFSACVTGPAKNKPAGAGSRPTVEKGVPNAREDRMRAPRIQTKLNALFLRMDEGVEPSGYAFAPERLERLEARLATTEDSDLADYRENREFFSQTPDSGGGFIVGSNGKRASAGELFYAELARLRLALTRICYSELEECSGDGTVEGRDLRTEVEKFIRNLSAEAFAADRRKFLGEYRGALQRYRQRKDWPKSSLPQVHATLDADLRWVKLQRSSRN